MGLVSGLGPPGLTLALALPLVLREVLSVFFVFVFFFFLISQLKGVCAWHCVRRSCSCSGCRVQRSADGAGLDCVADCVCQTGIKTASWRQTHKTLSCRRSAISACFSSHAPCCPPVLLHHCENTVKLRNEEIAFVSFISSFRRALGPERPEKASRGQ